MLPNDSIICIHWWLIGPCDLIPDQARDKGTCRLCGAVRGFPFVMVDTAHEAWNTVGKGKQGTAERDIAGFVAENMEREI